MGYLNRSSIKWACQSQAGLVSPVLRVNERGHRTQLGDMAWWALHFVVVFGASLEETRFERELVSL